MAAPGFWDAQERAQAVVQDAKLSRGWLEPFDALNRRVESAAELNDMLKESPDSEMQAELDAELESVDAAIGSFELRSLLRGEDDFRDAQVEITAGAGGYRGPGLGRDADADVYPLGGATRVPGGDPRPERGRGSGDQGCGARDSWRVRVRLSPSGELESIGSCASRRSTPMLAGTRASAPCSSTRS